MGRLVLTIIRLSVVSVASLVLLGVIMLPATLKPRSDLLVATGTANTANPAGIKLVFGPLSRNITRTELNQGPRLTLVACGLPLLGVCKATRQ